MANTNKKDDIPVGGESSTLTSWWGILSSSDRHERPHSLMQGVLHVTAGLFVGHAPPAQLWFLPQSTTWWITPADFTLAQGWSLDLSSEHQTLLSRSVKMGFLAPFPSLLEDLLPFLFITTDWGGDHQKLCRCTWSSSVCFPSCALLRCCYTKHSFHIPRRWGRCHGRHIYICKLKSKLIKPNTNTD